jgi:hypothetical protein
MTKCGMFVGPSEVGSTTPALCLAFGEVLSTNIINSKVEPKSKSI